MSEKSCATCYHAINNFLQQYCVCKTCNDYDKWTPAQSSEDFVPTNYPGPDVLIIIPPVYKSLVDMYDRYMEISLMIPLTDHLAKKINNMSEFFNRIIVVGLLEYEKQLDPIEKDFGIKK